MTQVNPKLLDRLSSKLGLSKRQIYHLISRKVNETLLPRHLAAIVLASEKGINITRYASGDDLAEIHRSPYAESPVTPSHAPSHVSTRQAKSGIARRQAIPQKIRKGNHVFVVHGRNDRIRKSLFSFLRAVGLRPMEWRKAIELTKKPSPYVGEILEAAFRKASAVVVLLTPDDEARLKDSLTKSTDPPYETELRGQPRPNVIFEAGMAFGSYESNTVLVQVGEIRPISDIAGRHTVRLSNSVESRQELITKLRSCGCVVDDSGSDWLQEGDFDFVEQPR